MNRFLNFLESLKDEGNSPLIETIKSGYLACLEALNIPSFRIREILGNEAKEMVKKEPKVSLAEWMHSWVIADEKDNKPIGFFPSKQSAEFHKHKLDEAIKEKYKPLLYLPPIPNFTLMNDEDEENVPPEIKSMNKEEKDRFFKWLTYSQRYGEGLEDLNSNVKEYIEKFPDAVSELNK